MYDRHNKTPSAAPAAPAGPASLSIGFVTPPMAISN